MLLENLKNQVRGFSSCGELCFTLCVESAVQLKQAAWSSLTLLESALGWNLAGCMLDLNSILESRNVHRSVISRFQGLIFKIEFIAFTSAQI